MIVLIMACYSSLQVWFSLKKKESNVITGALGSTWEHNFYMGTQNSISMEKWSQIFDSHLSMFPMFV